MQQLLKLLDYDNYVSRYKVCKDKVTIQDIFWSHPDSIKMFNTFLTMLIIDSTYKTNKYRLPLLKIVGVTSMEKTFFVDFSFLDSKKEDSVTQALEMCKAMLMDQKHMQKVIVTDRDTTLMNSVAMMFHISYALLCKYHMTENARSLLKPHVVGTKQINSKDGKIFKSSVVLEKIMDV